MCKYFLVILICILLLSFVVLAEDSMNNVSVIGLINSIDMHNNSIIVDGVTYNLKEGCSVYRNGRDSGLPALNPIVDGFYQWGELNIDENGLVSNIDAYYQVFEGKVEKISHSQNYLFLDLHNDSTEFSENSGIFYWQKDHREQIRSIKEGKDLVLVTAKDRILYIVQY